MWRWGFWYLFCVITGLTLLMLLFLLFQVSEWFLGVLFVGGIYITGPEKYREHRNGVPGKADSWQEVRSLYHEDPGR